MSKTKEELLLAYRKSNKQRRQKIVEASGYQTETEYTTYLMEVDEIESSPQAAKLFKHNEKKPVVHNVHIVDISFSMVGDKIAAAIKGVNGEIEELKKDDTVDYLQSIVVFSDPRDIKVIVDKKPIGEVQKFTTQVISGTALNQAVGETLTKLRKNKDKNEKILVKIFTDGAENSSIGEFKDYNILSSLIKECENEGFTITFIGTQRDVQNVVNMMKIDVSNTLAHDNTSRGIAHAYGQSVGATLSYSKAVKDRKEVTKGFFKSLK